MNNEKKVERDVNGNMNEIEMVLLISSIFYFLSIVQYYYVEQGRFFLDGEKSITTNLIIWLSLSTAIIFVCLLFITLSRILTLKFRTEWSGDVFSRLIRLATDSGGLTQWKMNFNSLNSLRIRSKIGYIFITTCLILVPILFIYILFWSSALTPINVFRIIIFSIHLVFIFTMGVINILYGIEPEIKRRFALWQIAEKNSATIHSVNIDGGCCEIQGKFYLLKLERNKDKRVENLYIDKSTNDQEIYIYI